MKHWVKTEEQLPLTWETGSWDGKRSDEVLVKDENGSYFVATYYEEYNEWYDNRDIPLTYQVIQYMEIPLY